MISKSLPDSAAMILIALAPVVGGAQERTPVAQIEPVHTREFYQAPVERCQQVPLHIYEPPAHRSSYGGVLGSIGDTMFGSTSGLLGAEAMNDSQAATCIFYRSEPQVVFLNYNPGGYVSVTETLTVR